MAFINEPTRLPDILRRELDPGFSREEVIVLQGQNLPLGAVIGRRLYACPEVATPKAGNVGNGTVQLVTAGPSVLIGQYRLVCTQAEAGGGVFQVFDPGGNRMADAVEGTEYDQPQLGFVINDGSVDFAVGDEFSITVAEGDGRVRALDPDAADGTQVAYGFLTAACNATGASCRAVAIKRDAFILSAHLVWPADITAPEKALALKQLAARGILDQKGV